MTLAAAAHWIKHLQLTQHIEGGWSSEVYRSGLILQKEQFPASFNDKRNICRHIYFLMTEITSRFFIG
jgi:predicted cupin superfamily sugar epimerase